MHSMLLMPLMQSTPGFWMPERRRQTLVTENSTGTIAIPPFVAFAPQGKRLTARDDNEAWHSRHTGVD